MNIQVYEKGDSIKYSGETLYLFRDHWDDYCFRTTFSVSYYNNGKIISIGQVKIGVRGMEVKTRRISATTTRTEPAIMFDIIPKQFTELDDKYFSLGQDESYYANISALGDTKRVEILTALQDVALDLNHFQEVRSENVMKTSLLRSVSSISVEEQLHRIATGGALLTKYNFSYVVNSSEDEETNTQLSFQVNPKSNPPTNIHVLIGRNGTGKTTLIKNMIHSICYHDDTHGSFSYNKVGRIKDPAKFSNVLCVAFSPFDAFPDVNETDAKIPYSYIGLKKQGVDLFESIEKQFLESFSNCMMNARKRMLWIHAIDILKSDITFSEIALDSIAQNILLSTNDNFSLPKNKYIKEVFSKLSSGHKVVLLIITCCVDKIVEKSIVFMDEPENHLHPPLLSALIRALSDLLIDRNGVAIISTHSPVVLQEVPQSCVYSLRRIDQKLIAERLPLKTFGASIGSLTNEVFGLEVTNSGYHKLLSEAVESLGDYEMISADFDNQLGNEAVILLRTLLALHKLEDE